MTVVRSALFNLFFFASTFALVLIGTPLRLIAPHWVFAYVRAWARLELAALRVICGIRFEVIGRDHLPLAGPALIASRHQSAFDTLVWFKLVPRCAYVCKDDLLRIPLFGPMIKAAGMIPVDREAGAASVRSLARQAREAARGGRHIVIFPEGTRSEFGRLVPLQPGIAALAGVTKLPVIPVATDSGLFWGRRAFRKHPGTIHIVIGAPIPPDLPRPLLMERLQSALVDDPSRFARAVGNSVGVPLGGL